MTKQDLMILVARSHFFVFPLNDFQVHTSEYPPAVNISKDILLVDLDTKFYWGAFTVAMCWVLELLPV